MKSSTTEKEDMEKVKMFEKIDYIVNRVDGDYVYLKNLNSPEEEDKCVARALIPADVNEGTRVVYEMMEYSIAVP